MTYTEEMLNVPTYQGVVEISNSNTSEDHLDKITVRFTFDCSSDGWAIPPGSIAPVCDAAFQAFVDHLNSLDLGPNFSLSTSQYDRLQVAGNECEPTV